MQNLIKGYQQFFKKYFESDNNLYQELQHKQSPHTLFLACCDSRVDPVLMVNAQPGDLFVVRNVANYVPPCKKDENNSESLAAVELALQYLPIKQIIILGHQDCAGVKLLATDKIEKNSPTVWREQQKQLKNNIDKNYTKETASEFEKINVNNACENLLTYCFVKDKIKNKTLSVTGWYFHLDSGKMETYNPESKTFSFL